MRGPQGTPAECLIRVTVSLRIVDGHMRVVGAKGTPPELIAPGVVKGIQTTLSYNWFVCSHSDVAYI